MNKLNLRFWRKNYFPVLAEKQFCSFSWKFWLCGFNLILWFWWENLNLWFVGKLDFTVSAGKQDFLVLVKMQFYSFGRKCNCKVTEKHNFTVSTGKCNIYVSSGYNNFIVLVGNNSYIVLILWFLILKGKFDFCGFGRKWVFRLWQENVYLWV